VQRLAEGVRIERSSHSAVMDGFGVPP